MNGPLRIYLGNLPPDVTAEDIRGLFAPHGTATDIELVADPQTGQPRGFGFATMDAAEAGPAIADLDGSQWRGHTLRVNESYDRGARPPRRSW